MSSQVVQEDPASIPTTESLRIESIDTLRGVALLGILLMNILGMGLHTSAYSNPVVDGATSGLNFGVWFTVDALFEGSMRFLFSMLFGAGVILFTTGERAKSGFIHYRRTFWLAVFGLIDIFLLLWYGDVLFVYALAGAILFLFRNISPKALIILSIVILTLLTALNASFEFMFRESRDAAIAIENLEEGQEASLEDQMLADIWLQSKNDFEPNAETIAEELDIRQGGYLDNARWIQDQAFELFFFLIPVMLLWDALAIMFIGMAFYKLGILDGSRSKGFYIKMAAISFSVGLAINVYELMAFINSDMDVLAGYSFLAPTYQIGRIGMGIGYLSLVMLLCKTNLIPNLLSRLAAVGRMALTNYLSHSLFGLLIFTGTGLALVGELQRWQLYLVVLAIWLFQLWFSPWWLTRYKFGPVEWLWRTLTYWKLQEMIRR